MKIDDAWPRQRLQSGNCSHQLHAIVGGVSFATFEFLFTVAESEDGPPTPGPRISGAGAVGVDRDALLTHGRPYPAGFSPTGGTAAYGNIPAGLSAVPARRPVRPASPPAASGENAWPRPARAWGVRRARAQRAPSPCRTHSIAPVPS